MSAELPRVAVLIDTSTLWGRSVVKGIVDYVRGSSRWEILVDWRGVHEQLRLPSSWRGDGVIARVTSQALARQIASLQVPTINVSWSVVPSSKLPQVTTDEIGIAQLAANYFLERGFRHFGYVGSSDQHHYVDCCGPTFGAAAASAGGKYWPFKAGRVRGQHHRLAKFAALERWLQRAPKPLAILVWDAIRGRLVADACTNLGLKIPDEVSVLVGYDDDLMCEIATPQLSAVDDRPEVVGYFAAKMLDELLRGIRPEEDVRRVPPAGIVSRQSTDTLAYEDPELSAAMAFIRENAGRPISVDDVLRATSLSRRSLEQRFAEMLGRSPAAEIRRIHLQRVKELLVRSEIPVGKIADVSGFMHAEVMTRAFRREVGMSPTEYRLQYRPR